MRLKLFSNSLAKIERLNKNPEDKAMYGINELSDLTEKEFQGILSYVPDPTDVKP